MRRRERTRLLWRVLVVSVLFGSSALAGSDAANEHYQRGVKLAKAGQHDAARTEFEAALRLEPHPRVLYNLAKLALEMGDSEAAMHYLHRYLEMDTSASPPEQVAEVRAALRALEGEKPEPNAAEPPPAPALPAPSPEAAPAPSPAAPTTAERATTRAESLPQSSPTRTTASRGSVPSPPPDEPSSRVATFALGGTGAALLAAGFGVWLWNDGTYGRLHAERTALEMRAAPEELDELRNDAYAFGENDAQFRAVQAFDAVSWSLMGAGVVCLGVATWLYLTSEPSRSLSPDARRVAFGPDRLILRW